MASQEGGLTGSFLLKISNSNIIRSFLLPKSVVLDLLAL